MARGGGGAARGVLKSVATAPLHLVRGTMAFASGAADAVTSPRVRPPARPPAPAPRLGCFHLFWTPLMSLP